MRMLVRVRVRVRVRMRVRIRWHPCCVGCACAFLRLYRTKTHKLIGTETCGNKCQGDDAGCTHVCVDCDMW